MAQVEAGFKIPLPAIDTPDPLPNRLFAVDSVWATFPDTAAIGVVYRAMSGKVAPAYIKNGTAKALTTNLFMLYPHFQETQRWVRVRVDNLTYVEDPTQGVELEIGLTFLRRDSTGQYAPFYRADVETEFVGFFSRGDRIQTELQRAFAAMNAYLTDPRQPAYLSDYEQKIAQAASDMKLDSARYDLVSTTEDNILTCQKRRPGVYISESELIANRPALTGAVLADQSDRFVILQRPNQRRARYRFFGFSDGDNICINSGRYGGSYARYAKVLETGRYLLWQDNYVTAQERAVQSAAAAGGGLLGGLIGIAATSSRDCIAIDTRTGDLLHITPARLIQILSDTPALLAEYEAAGKPRKTEEVYAFMVRYNQAVGGR